MRESFCHALAGLTVRKNASHCEVWVGCQQAQQFTSHITGATENECGTLHFQTSIASAGVRELASVVRPTASMMQSASAAPDVMALKAGTFSWS